MTSSSSSIGSSASVQDLNHWLEFVEDASRECEIQESQYPDAAVWFMRGELREVMRERRAVYLHEARRIADSKKAKIRDWEDFKKDLKRVVDEARRIFLTAASQIRATPTTLAMPNATHALISQPTFALLRRTHPYIASSLSLGLVIGGTVVLLPAIALGIEAWNRMKEGANRAGGQIACPT
ncbi:hypothetical protein HYPSUDRAFT_42739 [Hypholoma sublateritium FD-334 SS-4]|uniref:Uncharacterized protein n=1 Tax=Hypholoma sublateritium (strain FD-334 SS-4) TaxID=945553 RepID=A0A0D2NQ56_HYPSF|nr:hypothetical protein HYPSUDRAFT_42739 [Hypholoma sublateritium FD-334 SS-4]